MRRLNRLLEGVLQQFIEFPAIENWKLQYHPDVWGSVTRFKFLVLWGPSRMGKTEMAKSLFGSNYTFIANCQGVDEPNMQTFNPQLHRCILFDEATPEMIMKNKVLFQAGPSGVTLQESPTQMCARWIFLYQNPMIVCTNTWKHDEEWQGEFEWLRCNSVSIHITSPVFLEPQMPHSTLAQAGG